MITVLVEALKQSVVDLYICSYFFLSSLVTLLCLCVCLCVYSCISDQFVCVCVCVCVCVNMCVCICCYIPFWKCLSLLLNSMVVRCEPMKKLSTTV